MKFQINVLFFKLKYTVAFLHMKLLYMQVMQLFWGISCGPSHLYNKTSSQWGNIFRNNNLRSLTWYIFIENQWTKQHKYLQFFFFSYNKPALLKTGSLGPEMSPLLSDQLAAGPHSAHSLCWKVYGILIRVWSFTCITMLLPACYDGLYYSLGCCVCPPGGFAVIWAQPGSRRRAINEQWEMR